MPQETPRTASAAADPRPASSATPPPHPAWPGPPGWRSPDPPAPPAPAGTRASTPPPRSAPPPPTAEAHRKIICPPLPPAGEGRGEGASQPLQPIHECGQPCKVIRLIHPIPPHKPGMPERRQVEPRIHPRHQPRQHPPRHRPQTEPVPRKPHPHDHALHPPHHGPAPAAHPASCRSTRPTPPRSAPPRNAGTAAPNRSTICCNASAAGCTAGRTPSTTRPRERLHPAGRPETPIRLLPPRNVGVRHPDHLVQHQRHRRRAYRRHHLHLDRHLGPQRPQQLVPEHPGRDHHTPARDPPLRRSAPPRRGPPSASIATARSPNRVTTPARTPASTNACTAAAPSACPSLAQWHAASTAGLTAGATSRTASPRSSTTSRPAAACSATSASITGTSASFRASRRLPSCRYPTEAPSRSDKPLPHLHRRRRQRQLRGMPPRLPHPRQRPPRRHRRRPPPVQQHHRKPGLHQLQGRRRPADPGPDDNDVSRHGHHA